MYKNQLQELAQRSCFNLPSYSCIREGPDHAPRFKSTVNFNGDTFESPQYCSTLRQAEHSAAEVALNALSGRGPSNSLAARVLDETGVYKNLLQEVSQRVGASLPMYSTYRTGLGHLPVFTCTVELAGVIFTGEPAKNKKQAEKNAAMAAWTSLKLLVRQFQTSVSERVRRDEQEHVTVARALQKYLVQARMAKVVFPIMFQAQNPRLPTSPQAQVTSSKILPFIRPTPNRNRAFTMFSPQNRSNLTVGSEKSNVLDDVGLPPRPPKFPTAGATPYVPIRHFTPHHRFAAPVTIRNAIPVFSSPPRPPVSLPSKVTGPSSPVLVRPPMPVLPPLATIQVEDPLYSTAPCVKSDILLPAKTVDFLSENLKSSITISGRVEEHLLSKAPTVLPEQILPDILPPPEAAAVPLESPPIQKDSVGFLSTSAAT